MKLRRLLCGVLIVLFANVTSDLVAADKLGNLPESHPRDGLPNFFRKIENGDDITIAYIGGSITVQPGWRPKTLESFRKKYPNTRFTEVNAAITGTGSYLGVSRLKRDVLDHDPDLVFIEFAVNDGDGAFSKATFEGMVRQILSADITTDICFVYTATIHQVRHHLMKGRYQPSAQNMEVVAEHYGIPTIHMAVRVTQLLQDGKLNFVAPLPSDGTGKIDGKIVFSPDGAHPYPETGHQLYLEAIERSLPAIRGASEHTKRNIPKPLDNENWEDVKLIPLEEVALSPDWKRLPPSNRLAKRFSQFMPALWMAEKPHASIEFTFYGSAFGLYGVKGPDNGRLLVQIDDQQPFDATFFYVSSNPYKHFLKSLRLADDLPLGEHRVRISIDPRPIDKVELFKKRGTTLTETRVFENQRAYIGDIIVKGDIVRRPSTTAKFTIVMIGDTEDYTETEDLNQGFLALTRWTADNMKKRNIVFLTHVGDIVQDETKGPDRNLAQWKRADAAFDILDKRVPHLAYSVCQGNHDLETQDRPEGTPTRFHEYYGQDRFKSRSWYGGTSPSGNCHYQFFRAGGHKYLHLNMAWRPSEPDWEWARKLVAQTHQPTIISTHYYMDETKKRGEVGAAIFERLVEPNPHVFLVLGGHVIGHARQTSRNSAGLSVIEVMSNYEDRVNQGQNWFRIIEIDDEAGVIQVRTLTPGTDPAKPREEFQRDDTNEFRFEVDFRKRFGESASAHTASVAVENPLPVYHETRTPAARSQIGGRGLRLAAIDRQPNGTLHAFCRGREDQLSKWISNDNGLTWTQSKSESKNVPKLIRDEGFRRFSDRQPKEFLQENEREAHLLVLDDGRLLCTFARHALPNGIFAVVSDDQGKTWNTDEPTYLAGSLPEFFGKPVSIELEDGSILTAHSIRAYRQSSPDNPKGDSVVHVVRWRLLGDTRAPPTPNKEPLLTDPYAWAKYHNAGTGFTGNLQRISYWRKSSAKRVHLPDHYKGAMGRFPKGEMVVASYIEASPRYSRIYRSADSGASWTRVDSTDEMLLGKEQSILCLNDNKTVLLKTQIAGQPPYSPLYRSADGGITWTEIDYGQRSLSYPRNLIQFSDGSIAMFNSSGNYAEVQGAENTRAWRIRSFDCGLTWPERREVSGAWKRPRPFFTEATFLAISDTHILAAARVNGDHVHNVSGEIPPMGLGRHNAEINQKMALIESTDGGLSWSRERFVFDFGDVQARFLRLADGRILCTYRCRSELPFGVKAVFSRDDGKTWDLDHPVILGVHSTIFGTWQNDIELPDGTMRTAWARFYDGPPTFEVVHWQLPETQ